MRVRLRLGYRGRYVETLALLNTGYEGDVPEVLVPVWVAEGLGLWPRLPESALIETYKSASGLMRVYRIAGGEATLLAGDRVVGPISVYIAISEYTDEVLVNDQLISRFGIIIEDPARGSWRLIGGSPS